MKPELKLGIELIPSTSVGWNLHSSLVRGKYKEWADLAKERVDIAGCKCEICGKMGNYYNAFCYNEGRYKQKYYGVVCHERWSYDDTTHVQKLIGFIVLCNLCHLVKHINNAEIGERNGKLELKTVINHFKMVNECDDNTYNQHRDEAEKEYNRLSEHRWDIDFGKYAVSVLNYSNEQEFLRLHPDNITRFCLCLGKKR